MGATESKIVQVLHSEINLTIQELMKEIIIAGVMCTIVELIRHYIQKSRRTYARKVLSQPALHNV
jgi:Tfp pilus assembly protein PilE